MAQDDTQKKFQMYQQFIEPPKWMDRDYVHKALKEGEKDQELELLDYKIVAAVKPGDNFASVALRLKATFKTKGQECTKSYIVKVQHYEEGFQKEFTSDCAFFEVEVSMYAKTIPEMQRLVKEVNKDEVFAPPAPFFALKPNKTVFIEDISPEFVMAAEPLVYEDALKVMEKIATFHAISFYMGEGHKEMQSYTKGFVSEQMLAMEGLSNGFIGVLAQATSEWGPEMEIVSQKFAKMQPTFFRDVLKLFAKNTDGYNVLNHGDFHIKNIMFRDQKNYPNELDATRLIDFQLCIWATPAIDFAFAFYGMFSQEARNRRQELIAHYHQKFTLILQQLGYLKSIPTLMDLQIELLRNGLIEVFACATFLPLLFKDHEKAAADGPPTAEMMMQQQKAVVNMPELKAIYMKVFPEFLYKGYLG